MLEKSNVHHSRKMFRTSLQLFCLLLTIFNVPNVEPKFDFEKFILTEHIEEKFSLLSSKELLKNYGFKGKFSGDYICARDLVLYKEAIVDRQDWALQMLDASSKIPSGILGGNFIDLGSYDQCRKASGSYRGIKIGGHHCTFTVNPSRPIKDFIFKPMMSVCLPHSCTDTDLALLVNNTVKVSERLKELNATLATANCTVKELNYWKEYATIWYFSIVYLSFIVVCTLSDLVGRVSNDGEEQVDGVRRILKKFSIVKNTESIFNLEQRDTTLSMIHGLRLLSSVGLVFMHDSYFQLFASHINTLELYEDVLPKIIKLNAIAAFFVETFFVISGFLTTFAVLKNAGDKRTFNVVLFYLHRYIRLTPNVLVAVFVFRAWRLLPIMDFVGPRSYVVTDIFSKHIDSKIWSYFLYLQNFVDSRNPVLLHFWYVAVDMQLYVLSPLILFPLLKKPKLGLKILFSFMAISIVFSSAVIVKYKFPSLVHIDRWNTTHLLLVFDKYYQAPHVRASSWLLGALLGYTVVDGSLKLSKKSIYIGWTLGIASFLFSILVFLHLMSKDYVYNALFEGTFVVLARPAWAFGTCWIIYACLLNPKGLLSRFLSWKYFIPFSRLSYSLYIVHFAVIIIRIQILRTPAYYGVFQIFHLFIADLVVAFILALVCAVFFEAPALAINDIILKSMKKKPDVPTKKAN